MAVGAKAKQEVTQKILETFTGSFVYNDGKEIRIPVMEDGVERQIKLTLACAKVNVTEGADNAIPGTEPAANGRLNFEDMPVENSIPAPKKLEPTEEEKANIAAMLASLGL